MKLSFSNRKRGYTLIEALVASSILLIGIAAAASMSLQLVTQEEINERANTSFNYIDNAVRLVQLGVDPSVVRDEILPDNGEILGLTIEPHPVNIPNLGTRDRWWIKFAYSTTNASAKSNADTWTGGDDSAYRTEAFYVYRSPHFLTKELPRVQYHKSSGTP